MMSIKLGNIIKKLFCFILVQLFLFSHLAWARRINTTVNSAYLSPSVRLNISDFSHAYNYYYEQIILLRKADTTKGRTEFEKGFYNLSFKILFPEVIQYYLVSTIKQQLLLNVDREEVKDIRVELKTLDHPYMQRAYELFQQYGQKNLTRLVGAQAIINHLLLDGENKRFDLAGLNPPRKGAKSRDPYIKKWLINAITPITGYSKKELKDKTKAQLWILYYNFKLPYVFGRELIKKIQQGAGVDFNATVELNDSTVLELNIRLQYENNRFSALLTGKDALADKTQSESHPGRRSVLNFADILKQMPDKLREEIHIYENQERDFLATTDQIDLLSSVRDVSLAGSSGEVGWVRAEQARENLLKVAACLMGKQKSLKALQNLEKQKRTWAGKTLAYETIQKALKAEKNYLEVFKQVNIALRIINNRKQNLAAMIKNRALVILQRSDKQTFYQLSIIKRMAESVNDFVSVEEFALSLALVRHVQAALIKHGEFKKSADRASNLALLLEKTVEAQQKRQSALNNLNNALNLIHEVEDDLIRAVKGLEQKERLLRNRGFNKIADELNKAAGILRDIQKPGRRYVNVLTEATTIINKVIQNASKSSRVSSYIEKKRLDIEVNILSNARANACKRNASISKIFPEEKPRNVSEAVFSLIKKVNQAQADTSYRSLGKSIIANIDDLYLQLSRLQSGHNQFQSLTQVKDIIPGLIRDIKTAPLKKAEELIGRAI